MRRQFEESGEAMENQHNTSVSGKHGGQPLDERGAARRRFTRAGVGAAGVILTLKSQPGMAGTAVCTTPSGFVSVAAAGNRMLSHHPQTNACDYNRAHGFWKNHEDVWLRFTGVDSNTQFGKVFPASGRTSELSEYTLYQIVKRDDHAIKRADANNVALHTVTAFLNARAARNSGGVSILPEDVVLRIWTDYANTGVYVPTAGAQPWDGAQIAAYLESTFR